MNAQPSKIMTALPAVIATIAGVLIAFGSAYQQWAADNPDQAQWIGIPMIAVGAISGFAGVIMSVVNQMKAANAPPAPPVDPVTKQQVKATQHLLSLAIQQAFQDGNKQLVEHLADAMTKFDLQPAATVTPELVSRVHDAIKAKESK